MNAAAFDELFDSLDKMIGGITAIEAELQATMTKMEPALRAINRRRLGRWPVVSGIRTATNWHAIVPHDLLCSAADGLCSLMNQ